MPQQVVLKSLYGVPLDPERTDEFGWTEEDYWAAQQGYARYDELGYLIEVLHRPDYTPKNYDEAWLVCGRRWGKTDAAASTIVAYEATMGGHEAYVRPGQPVICFQIAQDLRMAKYSLHLIKATLESSPAMRAQIKDVVADRIDLKSGLTIVTVPPTLKSVRGYANPVTVLDEVGVWYQDSDSANPDYEIYRAVKPAQAQFPNKKLVGISSPWNKAGLLFSYFEAGTEGAKAPIADRERFTNCLVAHSPTGSSGHQRVTREFLRIEAARDPRAFEREYLAQFQDSISGFLSTLLLAHAVDVGVESRPPDRTNYYVAAIDPAFRHDSFALTVVHADATKGIVQDVIKRWSPKDGRPVDPGMVMREIAGILKTYGIPVVYSDQYQLESLQYIAGQLGFAIQGVDFTGTSKAEIYGSLQSLVNTERIRLLDNAELLKELRSIEKRMLPGGGVQITAPLGMHDDLATVTALAAAKSTWFLPATPRVSAEEAEAKRIKTPFEAVQEQLKRERMHSGAGSWD
jgi:hypothetical protein